MFYAKKPGNRLDAMAADMPMKAKPPAVVDDSLCWKAFVCPANSTWSAYQNHGAR